MRARLDRIPSSQARNFTMTGTSRILFAMALLAAAAPAAAHHSFAAEFDAAQPVSVEGVITKIRIVNPHSWVYLDVKGKDGSTTNWGFEFGTPILLRQRV
jgi:hypothetical protein